MYSDNRTEAVIRYYGPGETLPLLDTLTDIWADAHPEKFGPGVIGAGGSPIEAFHCQVTGHLRQEGFSLVGAYASGTLIGFGYGFPCTPDYWFGSQLIDHVPEQARSTDRLVGICELAVRPPWQSQGIGTRLHAELLKALDPEWSSLLARPDNERGHALYRRLGYRYAGPYRNASGGPAFDLLLLHVAITTDGD
ncbi:GNAT family N-acetyltransferase [Streptomyces sp. AV19]|uniref:GNAT family N-acetyltransferase n=1 Tax=Streptomyces sp. AV19 TaxID=2793068 RepID=UPI0018FE99CB|nr:N-acetyltransferase [Streptomyces sp. AV19]MBH1933099.1 GNAT family N-acetyltransferase [Streptomyces sp. AV19]MDG4531812.1 GNAT family N-acetyltransferase [Streptomyces sp. AV19]